MTIIGAGSDTLNVDDTGSTAAKTGTLTTDTLTGLAMAGITFSGISTLNISLGSGGNDFYLQGNLATTLTNLNLGTGTNELAVGSQAALTVVEAADGSGNVVSTGSTIYNLNGTINITGSGNDSMNVDDTGDTQLRNIELNPTSLEFYNSVNNAISAYLQINFTGFAYVPANGQPYRPALTISLGSYDQGVADNSANSNSFSTFLVTNTFTLTPPLNETTPPPTIVVNGDYGDVNFAVYDSHAVMTINGGTGNDNFYVFGNSQILNLNGDLNFSSNNGDRGMMISMFLPLWWRHKIK